MAVKMKCRNKLVLDHFFQLLDEHFLADLAYPEMASHVKSAFVCSVYAVTGVWIGTRKLLAKRYS
jgi:hypothetical protein